MTLKALRLSPLLFSLVVAACGGGGGESQPSGTINNPVSGPAPTPVPQSISLTGVAATGAPMTLADVIVKDASGAEICKTKTDDNGAYTCTLTLPVKTPLVVSGSKDDVVFYTPVIEVQAASANVANLTKLTNLISAQLSPTGEPSKLAEQIQKGEASVTAEKVRQVSDDIKVAIAPLLVVIDRPIGATL